MIRLKVPYFKQETGLSCGLACLRMVFGYFGDKTIEKELFKYVTMHSFGVFTTDLGVIAIKRGYKVIISTFHLRLFGPLKLPFGSEITLKILNSVKPAPKDKLTYESMEKYLKLGGKLIYDLPKISAIEDSVYKKVPCLVNVNTAALNRYWKNWDNGHYLTVNGVERDKISVLDPDPWDKTEYSIEKDMFLPAWSINAKLSAGHLMVIEK